jgi:hypothetical protein
MSAVKVFECVSFKIEADGAIRTVVDDESGSPTERRKFTPRHLMSLSASCVASFALSNTSLVACLALSSCSLVAFLTLSIVGPTRGLALSSTGYDFVVLAAPVHVGHAARLLLDYTDHAHGLSFSGPRR